MRGRDGLGRRDRRARRSAALNARGERVGVVQVRLYRPFPAAGAASTRCPRRVRRIAVLDRTKEPGSIGEPLFLDVVAALSEAHADGERAVMPRVIGGRYGLSSKEFTPGHGRRGVRRARARAAAARASRSASTTTSRGTSLRLRRRRSTSSRRTRCARCSSAWARTARSARTRTRSRSSGRGGPARPGLLRLRLEEVGLADGLAPALRAAADPGALPRAAARASSAATSSGCSSRLDVLGRAAPGATLLLNCPPRAGRGLGRAAAPGPGADPRQAASTSTRSTPARIAREVGPGRARSTSCCRPASSPSPACCRATRRSTGSRRRSRRPTAGAAPRWSSATTRRSTARWRGCTGSRCPTRVTADARAAADRCPRTRRSSCAPSPRR